MNTQPTTTKTGKPSLGILPCKNRGGLLVVVSVMQPQPTSKPSPGNRIVATIQQPDGAAGTLSFHPGTYSNTFAGVMQSVSELVWIVIRTVILTVASQSVYVV